MSNPLLEPDNHASHGPQLATAFTRFLSSRFDLRGDQAYEGQTLETVRKDVQFRGANLWILLFAILICSIGLNVNSPAVVIGAMLISPLMGPILGVGVGIGIYDFDLLLTGLKNLAIAMVASIAVSATYFALSPITEAQSELLARVSPTLWDVLIATFGGFAGIIAVSRREKGNALPGVAIATALMPPICTAGYAIATSQWKYLAGSLYLFFINIVFIAVSTFLLVRFMRFTRHQFVDAQQEQRVRRYILAIVAVVAVPSIYTAYTTVQRSLFVQRANTFIEAECDYPNAQIIARTIVDDDDVQRIEIVLVGEEVPEAEIERSRKRLDRYKLPQATFVVMQDQDASMGVEELAMYRASQGDKAMYQRNQAAIATSTRALDSLRARLRNESSEVADDEKLLQEARALFPSLDAFEYARLAPLGGAGAASQRRGVLSLPEDARLEPGERRQLARWLARRIEVDTVVVMSPE